MVRLTAEENVQQQEIAKLRMIVYRLAALSDYPIILQLLI